MRASGSMFIELSYLLLYANSRLLIPASSRLLPRVLIDPLLLSPTHLDFPSFHLFPIHARYLLHPHPFYPPYCP